MLSGFERIARTGAETDLVHSWIMHRGVSLQSENDAPLPLTVKNQKEKKRYENPPSHPRHARRPVV